ncbi:MAG: TonB-dependent siderophore receptor [Proteobacteria bacterium]|nr:TonB-dependent siderophore receptor [Pseudomonadota bacterium]
MAVAGHAAAESEQVMAPVRVTGTAESDMPAYQATTTRIGKMTQLPKDIPQAITIVTAKLIEDRNADTLKEALRNVAGLTFNAAEGGRVGDNMNLRGFYSFGDLYMDGIRDVAQYNRDTFNVEQIDVLRGSAAMLFGHGQAGGVINQASKEPNRYDSGEVNATVGSYNYTRITADVNKRIAENTAVRINAMKTDGGSSRDHVQSEREGLAPTIRWGIGTDHEFSLAHFYLKTHNVPDYGVPFFRQRPLDVPDSRFYGTKGDYENNTTNITTASYRYRISDQSELRTVLRGAQYQRDLWAVAARLAPGTTSINGNTVLIRGRQARGAEERTLTSQTDFNTRFQTGVFKHEALAGVELLSERATRWNYTSSATAPNTTVGNPNFFDTLPVDYGNRKRLNPNSYSGMSKAFYAQDVIEFLPGWKFLAGMRRDFLDASYTNGARVNYGESSYRTGISYQPTDEAHYYLTLSDSFNPTADLYQFTSATVTYPAERSKSLELGAKWELLDGDLSLRTSLYRAEKNWERNTDVESGQFVSILTRRRHTNGIELEAAGRLTRRWEVFAGLALMHSVIDQQAPGRTPQYVGMNPRNTPSYTFNLWSTYQFNEAWKAGMGVEGMGNRLAYGLGTNPGTTVVPNAVPGYDRWDAMLSYEHQQYTVKLNVMNLFDRRYYASIYENGGFSVPGTARTVQLSLNWKFR